VVRARVRRRLRLLGHARYRLLLLATLGSGVGNWLAIIALQVDVFDRTHSGWWVGGLLIANILPAVFIGLFFGPLVDRLSRKSLMIASDIGRLAVFVALPFAGSAAEVLGLATIAGLGNAFFRPAVLAGLPNLVADEDLADANTLLQIVDWTTTALAPLLGGVLVAVHGPHLAYWVNAGTFAFSAALVAGIPARLLQSERPVGRGRWADLREGITVVRGSTGLRCVLVVWTFVMVASGFVNLAEIFLARVSYHAGDFGFGLLWTGSGVGLIVGGFGVRYGIDHDLGRTYARYLLVFALGAACAAAAANVWIGAAAMVLAGIGNGGAVVANITLVQRSAADRVRGRAFTLIMSANYAALGLAYIVAGPVVDRLGARWCYSIAAGTIFCGALVAARYARLGLVGVEAEQA